jgi:hypothetical protein
MQEEEDRLLAEVDAKIASNERTDRSLALVERSGDRERHAITTSRTIVATDPGPLGSAADPRRRSHERPPCGTSNGGDGDRVAAVS